MAGYLDDFVLQPESGRHSRHRAAISRSPLDGGLPGRFRVATRKWTAFPPSCSDLEIASASIDGFLILRAGAFIELVTPCLERRKSQTPFSNLC
jgi:hypothetical protein